MSIMSTDDTYSQYLIQQMEQVPEFKWLSKLSPGSQKYFLSTVMLLKDKYLDPAEKQRQFNILMSRNP